MGTPDRLIILDTETTGLDPSRHRIVEVAWMTFAPDDLLSASTFVEIEEWDLGAADAEVVEALKINGALDRYDADEARSIGDILEQLTDDIGDGAVLCGINPAFDRAFLDATTERWGFAPLKWHYAMVDVKSMVAPFAGSLSTAAQMAWARSRGDLPWVGSPGEPLSDRHSALGDVALTRWLLAHALDASGMWGDHPHWPTVSHRWWTAGDEPEAAS